jgi:hypothetical protein
MNSVEVHNQQCRLTVLWVEYDIAALCIDDGDLGEAVRFGYVGKVIVESTSSSELLGCS